VDIGSRVDGFVAHIAAFRDIDVLDIRPIENRAHPRIRFVQADLMNPLDELVGRYPSVSCLHALEHFGLGRYSDPIDPAGHRKGFAAISQLVAPGGTLYISVPIGRARVEFNAHRVFHPREPLEWAGDALTLAKFDYVDDAGDLIRDATPDDARGLEYGCGIYTFTRLPRS
jgi:SAM-dependent methyltransferase